MRFGLDEIVYFRGAVATGILVFVAGMVYAVTTYGWFLGIGLGWVPAAFIACFAAFLWPLLAALLVGGIALLYFSQ